MVCSHDRSAMIHLPYFETIFFLDGICGVAIGSLQHAHFLYHCTYVVRDVYEMQQFLALFNLCTQYRVVHIRLITQVTRRPY